MPDKEDMNQRDPSQITQTIPQTTETRQHARCLKMSKKLLHASPLLLFLQQQSPAFTLNCQPCLFRKGGYLDNTVIICEDQITEKSELEDTLAHQLIHHYDNNTVQLDLSNPNHVACTEIRANTLSRECRFYNELKRGNIGFSKHFQNCVRRRAILGVLDSGSVSSREEAERVVGRVFNKCFQDTCPFDEIY